MSFVSMILTQSNAHPDLLKETISCLIKQHLVLNPTMTAFPCAAKTVSREMLIEFALSQAVLASLNPMPQYVETR